MLDVAWADVLQGACRGPGPGPCLSIPIFLNIIPRRNEGWDRVFNDLQPPDSASQLQFVQHMSHNVCRKIRYTFCFLYMMILDFPILSRYHLLTCFQNKHLIVSVENDFCFSCDTVCHSVYKHHDQDIILQANNSLCKFKNR